MLAMQKTLILMCCFFAASIAALYTKPNCPVVELTPENHDAFVNDMDHPVSMIELYAPWCGHCQNLSPAYEAAAKELKGVVPMGAINCEQYRSLCNLYRPQGYPTLKISTIGKIKNRKMTKEWSDYNGDRQPPSIVRALKDAYPNNINAQFGIADLERSIQNSSDTLPKAVLFADINWDNMLLKRLAYEYRGKVQVIQVVNRNAALAVRFKIATFPSLLVLIKSSSMPLQAGKEGFDTHIYKGKNEYASIREFVAPFLGLEGVSQLPRIDSKSEFDAHCLDVPGICIVALAPSVASRDIIQKLKILETLHHTPPIGGGKPAFSFSWINRDKHAAMLADFDSRTKEQQKSDLALLVLNAKRQKFAIWAGEWTRQNMDSLLADIKLGDFKMESYPSHPFYQNLNKAEL